MGGEKAVKEEKLVCEENTENDRTANFQDFG